MAGFALLGFIFTIGKQHGGDLLGSAETCLPADHALFRRSIFKV